MGHIEIPSGLIEDDRQIERYQKQTEVKLEQLDMLIEQIVKNMDVTEDNVLDNYLKCLDTWDGLINTWLKLDYAKWDSDMMDR